MGCLEPSCPSVPWAAFSLRCSALLSCLCYSCPLTLACPGGPWLSSRSPQGAGIQGEIPSLSSASPIHVVTGGSTMGRND